MTPAARAAVADGWARWANPSSPHAEGRAARAALEDARARIAAAHGWTGEVILTSGATESLAIALTRAPVTRRLVSAVEHDAVLRVCPDAELLPVGVDGLLAPPRNGEGDRLPAWASGGGGPATGDSPSGVPPPPRPAGAVPLPVPGGNLLCLQWANSETGVKQPLAAIAAQVHAVGDLLLVDAAQLPACLAAEVTPHADFVALSAHKHGGAPGIGALLVRDLATLTPTGGQERGYRPGTENLPAALGWAAALAEPEPVERWAALRARLDDAIVRSGGEVVAAASPPPPGDRQLPHARRRRDDAADPLRPGGHRGQRRQRLLVRVDEAQPCAGRDGLERGGEPRGNPHQLRPRYGRGGCGARDRDLARGDAGNPPLRRMIYLDYQATTPLAPEALDAMLPWLKDQHANPHSAHRPGRAAKAAVEVARDEVAALLPPGGRVVFTSGATEALNWAIKGSTGPIATWATEHAAVLDTAAAVARAGRSVTVLPVDAAGLAAPAPTSAGGLHAAMLVNNEIGAINPVERLADAAHAAGALFLCDAVQGYGRVPIPANVDLVALSAHKVHGPKGIGALWIRDGVELEPLFHGGDQEGGRSGTLSPALCAGFGAAARLMRERGEADAAHVGRLWEIARDRLSIKDRAADDLYVRRTEGGAIPLERGWTLNGPVTLRYHGNLNLRRAGLDVARLMSDCRDIAFSAGSACASGSGRPSHVLRAIGLTDAQARASIRLGFGRYTTRDALTTALDQLIAAADRQQDHS